VAATGGRATGGSATGGTPTGGTATGGTSTGGRAAGGTATGGTPSGGTATGGTATGGKATGGTATGGTGTGGCSVTPVTPNATQQTKNLLCYLYSIKGNHVLSGQQETNWNANPTNISWYVSNIGKYPAVLGSDFMYRDGVSCSSVTPSTNRGIAYWNAGGITMFRYHMGMPGSGLTCTADCYQGANCSEPTTRPTAAFFTNVVTAGTAENTSLKAKLDYMAVQINAMKAANVPVILAIYHEAQSNGWFWWSETTSGSAFVNLWTYTFDYLTNTKGLTNIVWLMPFSGSPSSAFYPGKNYVDIGGPDEYTQPSNLLTFNASANYNPAVSVLGSTMPITLHETGSAVQPDYMFPTTAPWVLWNVWANYENTAQGGFTFNTVASLQAAYASQYTITRDEIPNLK
jgi:beta-mannanase